MTITLALCIVTFLISFQGFSNYSIVDRLRHYPVAEYKNKEYYRFLSSGFVHGSWLHLIINLFVLYQFGPIVENIYIQIFGNFWGPTVFLLVYLTTIIAADIPTYFKHRFNASYSAIGASGAVSGVVFIYILFFPWDQLSLYGIIPFRAIVGGVAYLVYSSWASRNRNDRIDHSAHFYGALYGIIVTIILEPAVFNNFIHQLINNWPY